MKNISGRPSMASKPWREIQAAHSKCSSADREATKARAVRDLEIELMTLAQIRRAHADADDDGTTDRDGAGGYLTARASNR